MKPTYRSPDKADGGIRRVTEALEKGLPEHGIYVTDTKAGADLMACHGTLYEADPSLPLVTHCHGMYWSEYIWPRWGDEANSRVIKALKGADAVTATSLWVRNALVRGLFKPVQVIYHGVDLDEWPEVDPDQKLPFALWNKGRVDIVSNPEAVDVLAEKLPRVPFVTTFAHRTRANIRITGAMPYEDVKTLVQQCSVYLATCRETFGIGTLEAMASGSPVVGWAFGGQEEIVIQGKTGFLVPFGDYQALADALEEALAKQVLMGKAARQDVVDRWQWTPRVAEYATFYKKVLEESQHPVKVSVIIPCHNLVKFLPDAVTSVVKNLAPFPVECIIVDDRSQDGSFEMAQKLADQSNEMVAIKAVRNERNLGLSLTRNKGAELSQGEYIIYLDADDMLAPGALQALVEPLDADRSIDIAYGKIAIVNEQGGDRRVSSWPNQAFNWQEQVAHLNQLGYAAMQRREVVANIGGYRKRDWRSEDAAYWCLATSYGYTAKMVTQQPTLTYRLRSDSKTQEEHKLYGGEGDWTQFVGGRLGAYSADMGRRMLAEGARTPISRVPFGAQGTPPKSRLAWDVPHNQDPIVSVIIPVGKGHEHLLIDALDSVLAQTFRQWECIVVDDTGNDAPLPVESWAHWVTFLRNPQGGAGSARNTGARHAKAPLLFFLDADDLIDPTLLHLAVTQYGKSGGYVYSSAKVPLDPDKLDLGYTNMLAGEYNQLEFISSGYGDSPGQHGVGCLVAKADWQDVGGFSEKLPFYEDWAFFLELAVKGVEGHHIPDYLYIYRTDTGTRRKQSYASDQGKIKARLARRFQPYATGVKQMAGCNCGKGGPKVQALASNSTRDSGPTPMYYSDPSQTETRLKYIGNQYGAVTYTGANTRRKYRAGLEPVAAFVDVDPSDVASMLLTGDFEVVSG